MSADASGPFDDFQSFCAADDFDVARVVLPICEVGGCVAAKFIGRGGEEYRRRRAEAGKVPRHDEAIAAVIAFPAQNDNSFAA